MPWCKALKTPPPPLRCTRRTLALPSPASRARLPPLRTHSDSSTHGRVSPSSEVGSPRSRQHTRATCVLSSLPSGRRDTRIKSLFFVEIREFEFTVTLLLCQLYTCTVRGCHLDSWTKSVVYVSHIAHHFVHALASRLTSSHELYLSARTTRQTPARGRNVRRPPRATHPHTHALHQFARLAGNAAQPAHRLRGRAAHAPRKEAAAAHHKKVGVEVDDALHVIVGLHALAQPARVVPDENRAQVEWVG